METENCFDSDTSDSWSILAISEHENEITEGIDAVLSTAFETCASDIKNVDSSITRFPPDEKIQNLDSLDSSTDLCNNEKSLSKTSKDLKDFQVLYKGKTFKNDYHLDNKSSRLEYSKTSCCDENKIGIVNEINDIDNGSDNTDSFSVISESESHDEKLSPYETDENWDEKQCDTNIPVKSYPNILKRKSKRIELNYRESSQESVNNDLSVHDGKLSDTECEEDVSKNDSEFEVKEFQNASVYRHYRNNVANTMLIVAVSAIFTGVAFIAVSHFLGVHDAQYAAVEMMATLERLKMENDLLQTRLTQLNNCEPTPSAPKENILRNKGKSNFRPNKYAGDIGRKYVPENWYYKRSKSREKYRKNNRVKGDSTAFFKSGKNWGYSRPDDGMWQFRRALARENSRI